MLNAGTTERPGARPALLDATRELLLPETAWEGVVGSCADASDGNGQASPDVVRYVYLCTALLPDVMTNHILAPPAPTMLHSCVCIYCSILPEKAKLDVIDPLKAECEEA